MSCVGNKVNRGTDLSTVMEENPRKTSEKPGVSGLNMYLIVF